MAAGFTSDLASARYRITVPAAALASDGVECRLIYLNPSAKRSTLLDRFDGADAVVLGKLLSAEVAPLTLELVARLRDRGVKVLADYSDDHFTHPSFGPVYRELGNSVDRVTASTPALAAVLEAQTASPVSVITDPVEGQRGDPRDDAFPADREVSLLWFGHPTNLDTLKYGLRQLESAQVPYRLTLITAPRAGGERIAADVSESWRGTGRSCRFVPWSVEAVFSALRECDATVIPSDPFDPRKLVKSPNRFTEALWAGRFVLAHPLPAYEELAAYGWVGEDLADGLMWYARNRDAAAARVQDGQSAVAERFAPQAVARVWREVIAQTLERPER
jgi:hypothetical protein